MKYNKAIVLLLVRLSGYKTAVSTSLMNTENLLNYQWIPLFTLFVTSC